MTRVNLLLTAAVLGSAFFLVHTQYETRRLYTAVDRAQSATRKLDAEYAQLQVQKREMATPARVQSLASSRLKMRAVNPAITEYVQVPPAGPASAEGERP